MPLTTCVDCEREISTEAFVCPGCGRPTGKQKTVAKKMLGRMLLLWIACIVGFLAIWQFMSPR